MPKFKKGEKEAMKEAVKAATKKVKDSKPLEELKDPKAPKKKETPSVKTMQVEEIVAGMNKHLARVQEDIKDEFVNRPIEVDRTIGTRKSIVVENEFWDAWLQKLFAQTISVKLWIIALITALLIAGLITSAQFATMLGLIMGLKGTFQVASVWKNGHSTPSAMDKT